MRKIVIGALLAILGFFGGYQTAKVQYTSAEVLGAGDYASYANAKRAANGLPALAWDDNLAARASSWANHMASTQNLSHSSLSFHSGFTVVGENVGYGPDDATINQAFWDSASHRANILDKEYTHIGVGHVVSDGRIWVAVHFGARETAPPPPPEPAPAPKPAPEPPPPPKLEPAPAPAPTPEPKPTPTPSKTC